MELTLEQIKDMFKKKGYKFFENGDYNMNVFSIRTSNKITNKFDDYFYCVYKQGIDGWQIKKWKCTNKPGYKYTKELLSNKGVAILKEGQWKYKLGLHKGKEGFVQAEAVIVWRDANKDYIINKIKTESGWFGINIHRAGKDSINVDGYSAGCTVFKKEKDFLEFLNLMKISFKIYGNTFTYTVFEL